MLVDHVGDDNAIDNLGNGGDIDCIDKEHGGGVLLMELVDDSDGENSIHAVLSSHRYLHISFTPHISTTPDELMLRF